MLDLALRSRLDSLAREAAERLRELSGTGDEIPFEVVGPGEGSPFAQYAPMTARFVRDQAAALADLDAFAEACAAIASASIAAPYLEQLGEAVPEDADRRVEAAAIVFLSRLWEGSTDFSLEGDRLAVALSELEGCTTSDDGEAEIVAPLIGFHMPTIRLQVGDATLVRADLIEVPDEVRRIEGARRGAWEPQFLAIVSRSIPLDDHEGGSATELVSPGSALRDLVRALRLFKPGGVGLGPYAWARTPGDRWRRLAIGTPLPRPGGYRLTDSELGDLAALARALAAHRVTSTLARAISRFEAGLERPALLEALSDYVLTLRYLLEGGGPAGVGLAMRAAAIRGEPHERPEIKSHVERALALERALMRGEPPAAADEGPGPLEQVAGIEELTRAILRDAACGRLGSDLRAAADEALLADGLTAGEGAVELRGETAEWDAVEPEIAVTRQDDPTGGDLKEIDSERPTTVLMTAKTKNEPRPRETDWLSEVDSRGDTLDWPERPEALKLLDRRPAEREATRKRVRHLFPRPETTDWRVAELQYDRSRRSRRLRV